MDVLAEFQITDSLIVTNRGLVIVGDIVSGKINMGNYVSFYIDTQLFKLKIEHIDYVNYRIQNTAKIGIRFYKAIPDGLKPPPQTAIITAGSSDQIQI